MRKNNPAAIVRKTVETYADRPKKLTAELKRLLKEGEADNDLLLIGAVCCNLAEIYHAADDERKAFVNALKAEACLKDTGAFDLLIRVYTTLGSIYLYQDNSQMALSMDEAAWQLVRRHRVRGKTRIAVLNSLSANYYILGDVRKSIHLLTECLALTEESPDEDLVGRTRVMLNLAAYRLELGEREKAYEVLMSMAPWIDKAGSRTLTCDYYLRCAILSHMLEKHEQAGVFADKAFLFIPEDSCPVPLFDDFWDLLKFLFIRNDRERADRILKAVRVFEGKNQGTLQQIFTFRILAEHCRVFGEPERAVEYYKKLEELHDIQSNEIRKNQLRQIRRMKEADSEIRNLKKEMQRNEELASLEPMTKLLNRASLLRVSSEFIENAAKKGWKVGAIFIDIDFFKECNDTYGHARGDEIIREVARACRKEETKNVRFSRYGGDEYFGITQGLTDEKVCDIARRIAAAIRNADLPHAKNPNGGRVTLSIGVVNLAINDRTNTILDIANSADKALYYAKSAGKDRIIQQVLTGTDDGGSGASYVRIEF
ncbi:MAG: diguanylate cyclase [Lachnospiraceae bacterium]|nr:diguanylate cyclase [Lachnospiraceae bacterium]